MAQQQAPAIIILEERDAHEYTFTDAEVEAYALDLGIDLEFERDLIYLAKAGLQMPLPEHWKACRVEGQRNIFFFNSLTGESTWDDPCDELQREVVRRALEERVVLPLTLSAEPAEAGATTMTLVLHNLAGHCVARASFASPAETTLAVARDEFLGQVEATLPKGTVPRLLLADATMLGHSAGSRLLSDIFA